MSQPVEERADPRIGTTVAGRYFLHRRLGKGGAGTVYRATELGPERVVALKLLDREGGDPTSLPRFEREVSAAAKLTDPGRVEILDSGRTEEGLGWIAMELVDGRDLARVLDEDGPLTPARAGYVAERVLELLAEAHTAGIVHRDLKPANVMIATSPGGGPERVKVLDFGISVLGDDGKTAGDPGVLLGTPAYMSPEQLRGEPADGRADLFAVGALLFEMLTGAPPFEGKTPAEVAARQLRGPAPSLAERRSGVSPVLAQVVARALELERERRFGSAEVMRTALAAALPGERPGAGVPRRPPPQPTARFVPARPASARRRRLAAAGVLVAALAAAWAATWLHGSRAAPAAEPARLPAALAAAPEAASDLGATPVPSPAPPERPTAGPSRSAARRAPRPAAPPAAPAPASSAIRLVRGALGAIPTPPVETGEAVLVLQAIPWAEVSVDGEPLGETPREVRLLAGVHEVRAVHPELGARTERVTLRAGDRTLWIARFRD